jgi:arylsulfatase
LKNAIAALAAIGTTLVMAVSAVSAVSQPRNQSRPNIVLIFPDNLGVGELSSYGGNRGVATPRLDHLASEGLRLTNFNAEYFCIASRAAILTGRHSIRSGTHGYRPQRPGTPYAWHGLTQWEITVAEMLAPLGYTSAVFGKWHLGDHEERLPTRQGFDEWYAIPLSSNEAERSTTGEIAYIWEGRAGEPARKVKEFNLETRRTLDREATDRGVAFMERSAKARRPFFLFLSLTQIHYPTLPHPEFAGKTGAGDIGDAIAELDRNVGVVLDAVKRLGVENNTIFIFAGDGGAEWRRPYRGTAGPWRGFYATGLEGGLRTPFIIRWPGRIPAARVSNDIVHQVDMLPTLANAVGAAIPSDRAIDGVNQLAAFAGKAPTPPREGFPIFIGNEIRAVKWRDWKLHYAWQEESGQPLEKVMKLFNLRSDPKEETDVLANNPWAVKTIGAVVDAFNASLQQYPLVPVGTPEPYAPGTR